MVNRPSLIALALLTLASPVFPQTPSPSVPMTTAPAADPMFAQPYTDIDEWRDTPERHRYVHGGFRGTDMRFSFYFPEAAQYQGRFFQYVTPVPDNENLAQVPGDDKIGFSISSGAYFIETNGGSSGATAGPAFRADPTIGAYRANAAAAQYSRTLAQQMYGAHRTYGYLYGGSGGGYRTLGSMENTNGVWDGAVPFVLGSPMAAPNVFAVRMHAMRILRDKFPQIVDAMDAGGSGNPYAGLNPEETAALHEVTRMGFPLRSWFGYRTMGVHAFTALYQGMVMADPGYFTEFWTTPGYLGFDHPESFAGARVQFRTTARLMLDEDAAVARGMNLRTVGATRGSAESAWQHVVSDGRPRPVAVQLDGTPPDVGFLGGDLLILSGEGAGGRLALRDVVGDVVTLGVVDPALLAKLKPGDEVQVDNSNFLAAQTYHRHQVPDASYRVWDQFRNADGSPIYPQRRVNLGPLFALGAAGTVPTGHFNGKIIVVGSMLDREAFAWQSDWYRQRFDANYGADAINRYRLWYVDHALHGASEAKDAPTQAVSYLGVLHQALRDVSAWVEFGVPPPATSGYRVEDGQTTLAATATARHGVQPTVNVAIHGRSLARVRAGQEVELVGSVEVPPGTGMVVMAEWSFDNPAVYVPASLPATPQSRVTVRTRWRPTQPGTYFPTLHVASERNGNVASPYARIENIGRVRVVVE